MRQRHPAQKMIANSYNNLAWLLALKDGQGKDALVDIDHAIKLVGRLPDYLDTRGIIYLGLKRTKIAINDLEIAVKADPSPVQVIPPDSGISTSQQEGKSQAVLERGQRQEAR